MSDLYLPKQHQVRARQFKNNTNESAQEIADWINSFGPEYHARVIPIGDKHSPNPAFAWLFFRYGNGQTDYALRGMWIVYELGEFSIFSDEVFKHSYDPIDEKEVIS